MAGMTGGFVGMTPAQGRALAAQLERSATTLQATVDRLIARLGDTPWQGTDRSRFEEQLLTTHRSTVTAARQAMQVAAREVRSAAAEQERISGR
jgi:hypothetical protein